MGTESRASLADATRDHARVREKRIVGDDVLDVVVVLDGARARTRERHRARTRERHRVGVIVIR